MNIEKTLGEKVVEAAKTLYNTTIELSSVSFQKTNKEFEGDITLVVFPYLKVSKKSPEETARQIGEFLKANAPEVAAYNVVKGFLNLVVTDKFWLEFFSSNQQSTIHNQPSTTMVEYSSPNTNKPLHLGHVRNILLGHAVSEILQAVGNKVIKVNLVNDRGIHICKSMLAWQKWGNGETPESAKMKGDHLIGKYYVEFDKQLKPQIAELKAKGISEEEAEKKAPLMLEAQEMLRQWEAGDKEVIDLWKKMNGWVYDGFASTYKDLGTTFEKTYYESETYLLGKELIEMGLQKGVLQRNPDSSVFIDLTADKLDKKILLRSDGTSVYMTQDLGTAVKRQEEFGFDRLIYTVGNEQDYHFKVLFLILKKLGFKWAEGCYHLSYGMVELPDGKMKSREGTVVDADELIAEMISTARQTSEELGKLEGFTEEEKASLYRTLGLGALKYFILKVDPKKKMLFNPKESIDFNGNTGPFIQYTHARIQSIFRKGGVDPGSIKSTINDQQSTITKQEKELIKMLYNYPAVLKQAATTYNPADVANYVYDLAKEYNQFYHDLPILKEEKEELKNFRLALSARVAEKIKSSMNLLGIEVPDRM